MDGSKSNREPIQHRQRKGRDSSAPHVPVLWDLLSAHAEEQQPRSPVTVCRMENVGLALPDVGDSNERDPGTGLELRQYPQRPSGPGLAGEVHFRLERCQAAGFFAKSSFANPTIRNTFGSLKRNSLWGTGQYWQPNLALTKDFHVTEGKYAQFRFESYNFLNHNTPDVPNLTTSNANFTKILTRTVNRTMQLGLRFVF